MLRFFRHGDGTFAHFNGMGPTPADSLATALAYDDARGSPVANAPHSGYQRLEAGGTVMIADTGRPPPISVSSDAHAGSLSFELSSGRNRLVINCGTPESNRDSWRTAARQTAAHSTAAIEDTSSCRFVGDGAVTRLCGTPVIEGPAEIGVDRFEHEGAQIVRASHDGYRRRFGLVHQRAWRLSLDGRRLDGEDVFQPASEEAQGGSRAGSFTIRFHLHPSVTASRISDGPMVLLALPGGERWVFSAPNAEVEIEESVFLAASGGPRRCEQIVVTGQIQTMPRLVWTFMRAEASQL